MDWKKFWLTQFSYLKDVVNGVMYNCPNMLYDRLSIPERLDYNACIK